MSEQPPPEAETKDLPDYVVIRPAAGLPEGVMPEGLDGKWFDKSRMAYGGGKVSVGVPAVSYQAVPTGRLETRDDGAVAEVWEVRRA